MRQFRLKVRSVIEVIARISLASCAVAADYIHDDTCLITLERRITQSLHKGLQWLSVGILFQMIIAVGATAQTNYGSVRGIVSDPKGAVISGASVVLLNDQTKITRNTTTNTDGEYLFTAVDPGSYSITTTAAGFEELEQKGVTVAIGAIQTVDVSLKPGSVVQQVVVSADLEIALDTATASEGLAIDEQKLQDLPNLGRNPFVFDKLDNNVTPTGDPRFVRAEDQSGTTSVSVAGAPIGSTGGATAANNYVVDGIPVSTSAGGATFIPSLEAVADAKVQANTYDAEVGRAGGGVFNSTLKSGSSAFHGTLYGETRQTNWVANTWANNQAGIQRPDSNTYLYAGAFGGPVPFSNKVKYLNNTFFWITEEGYRQAQPYTSSTNSYYVPTSAERSGDFSAEATTYPLYDPTAAFVNGARSVTFESEYGSNKIPANLINPIGQYIVDQFPACNANGLTSGSCGYYGEASQGTNFLGSDDFKTRSDMYSGKVDHVFSSRWSGSASYVHLATQEPNGNILHVFAENDGVIHRFNDATAVNNVFTLTPTTVMTVGYGFNRYYSDTLQYSSGFNQMDGFGGAGFPSSFVTNLQSPTFPSITLSSVSNATGLGAATSGPTVNASKNVVVGIVKTFGKNNFKAGYVFRSMNDFVSSASGANGSYTFSGMYTDTTGKASSNSPYSIADLLMGLPGSSSNAASVTVNAVGLRMNEKYNALYAQDDVRWNEKLSFNVGIRYEYELGQTEATNRYNVGFNPALAYTFPSSTAPAALGGLVFAGAGGSPVHCCALPNNKFNPRAGFAYSIRKGTVVRGGFGVFYAGVTLNPYSTGYSQTTNYTNTSVTSALTGAQVGANAWLSNPFPGGLLAPTGNTLGALTGVGSSVTAQSFGRRYPFVDQYSADVEQELPGGIVLKVGWVGAHARNWGQSVGLDQLPDAVMAAYAAGGVSSGTNLAATATNPYYAATVGGYPSTGNIASKTLALGTLLTPYPQFSGTTTASGVTVVESNGKSRYNALDIKVQRRMTKGLSVLATYTWSSNWDNLYGSTSTLNSSTAGMQDNYNLGAEYARSINDMPNRVTAAVSYQLPFGRGNQYFSNMNRYLDYVAGGWQVNDEWIDQNGSPLALTQTDLNNSGTYGANGVGGLTQRPNLIAGMNPCKSGKPENRDTSASPYFNLSAFAPALPDTYGNTPRTIPCEGPGYDNQDISIFKNFKAYEGVNIQVRVEALNAFNTAELGPPATAFTVYNGSVNGTNYAYTKSNAYFQQTVANACSGQTGCPALPSTGTITSSLGFGRIIQIGGRVTF